jgi:NAD(P)H-dependent FMN reductase
MPDSTLIELRDLPMPLYDGDLEASEGIPEGARRFKRLLAEHDILVIASPEYNGFFPALVKNAIDWATRPEPGESHSQAFRGKKIVLLSASPGPGGGRRGLVQLREQMETVGARVVGEVAVPKALSADFSEVARRVAELVNSVDVAASAAA